MWKNTVQGYGLVSILLHWGMAAAVIGLFAVGLYMTDLTYYDPMYKTLPYIHKSLGVLVFGFLVFRLIWRIKSTLPAPDKSLTSFEISASHWVHRLLYILLFFIVLSGYFISTADGRSIEVFSWFEIPAIVSGIENQEDYAGTVHYALAVTLMALVILHGAAALKHHFINKDNTLVKMTSLKYLNQTIGDLKDE